MLLGARDGARAQVMEGGRELVMPRSAMTLHPARAGSGRERRRKEERNRIRKRKNLGGRARKTKMQPDERSQK